MTKANLDDQEKRKLCELLEIMVLQAKTSIALKNAALAMAKHEDCTAHVIDARALLYATRNALNAFMVPR